MIIIQSLNILSLVGLLYICLCNINRMTKTTRFLNRLAEVIMITIIFAQITLLFYEDLDKFTNYSTIGIMLLNISMAFYRLTDRRNSFRPRSPKI